MGFPPPGAILSVPPPGMILSVLPPWHKQGEGTHIHPPEAHKILKITRKTIFYNKTNIMIKHTLGIYKLNTSCLKTAKNVFHSQFT